MNTKPLTPAMLARLETIKAAGRLQLPVKHRGAWFDGFAIDSTLQALIDRGLVKIVTLKNDPIVAGGCRPRYARLTEAGKAVFV